MAPASPSPDDCRGVVRALAAWIRSQFGSSAGGKFRRLTLHHEDDSAYDIRLPILDDSPLVPVGPSDPTPLPAVTAFSGCCRDILAVIRETGHHLTTSQILAELDRRGFVHGESTVRMTLARMVRIGLLVNRQRPEPRGYGLPEWLASLWISVETISTLL